MANGVFNQHKYEDLDGLDRLAVDLMQAFGDVSRTRLSLLIGVGGLAVTAMAWLAVACLR